MTVRARLQIDDKQIEQMDLTITLTMTVQEWRETMRQLPRAWPCWDVSNTIADALGHIARATDAKFSIPKE